MALVSAALLLLWAAEVRAAQHPTIAGAVTIRVQIVEAPEYAVDISFSQGMREDARLRLNRMGGQAFVELGAVWRCLLALHVSRRNQKSLSRSQSLRAVAFAHSPRHTQTIRNREQLTGLVGEDRCRDSKHVQDRGRNQYSQHQQREYNVL